MPSILNAPPHAYAHPHLDRAAHRRLDSDWLARRRVDPTSRIVLLANLRVPVLELGSAPRLWAPSVAELGRSASEDAVFLGELDGVAWFAMDLGEEHPPQGEPVELRTVSLLLPSGEASTVAYARALAHWHRRHRFCGICGAPTRPAQGGHARRCEACAVDHFPRTDPAVIVLVTCGDACLLGRSPRFPPGMFSTLAGFVEPGESLEDTLRREVFEEAGVVIEAPVYRSSQPWPFPQSLMLGFRATSRSRELRLDRDELEDAGWFTREALRDEAQRPVRLPNPDSIARFLIEEWLAEAD